MASTRHPAWTAALVLAAGAAAAAGLTGAAAVKDRQVHMKALGAATKVIGEQFHSGAPDMAILRLQGAKIDAAAKALPTWFPAGSGPAASVKTKALALIWTDPARFATKAHDLELAAAKFDRAAQAGDAQAIGPAAHDLGAACKGCHETFKEKDRT
ncbi:MAG TPA: cytochrome c [Caulobacteraceae bacterium]|jgi:cytochrome c556